MAVVMAAAAATMAAIGLAKAIKGGIDARKARKGIDAYKRQTLTNPYEGLQVSTLGAMQQQQNAAQNTASSINALRQGGAQSMIGGLGRVVNQNNLVNQGISAGLDEQFNRNQQLIAQGDQTVQNMTELREREDLAGLGQAYEVGRQDMWNGMGDAAQAGMTYAGAMGGGGAGGAGGFQSQFGGNQVPDFSGAIPLSTQGVNWSNVNSTPIPYHSFNNQQDYSTRLA